jgi:hypothetical protein
MNHIVSLSGPQHNQCNPSPQGSHFGCIQRQAPVESQDLTQTWQCRLCPVAVRTKVTQWLTKHSYAYNDDVDHLSVALALVLAGCHQHSEHSTKNSTSKPTRYRPCWHWAQQCQCRPFGGCAGSHDLAASCNYRLLKYHHAKRYLQAFGTIPLRIQEQRPAILCIDTPACKSQPHLGAHMQPPGDSATQCVPLSCSPALQQQVVTAAIRPTQSTHRLQPSHTPVRFPMRSTHNAALPPPPPSHNALLHSPTTNTRVW